MQARAVTPRLAGLLSAYARAPFPPSATRWSPRTRRLSTATPQAERAGASAGPSAGVESGEAAKQPFSERVFQYAVVGGGIAACVTLPFAPNYIEKQRWKKVGWPGPQGLPNDNLAKQDLSNAIVSVTGLAAEGPDVKECEETILESLRVVYADLKAEKAALGREKWSLVGSFSTFVRAGAAYGAHSVKSDPNMLARLVFFLIDADRDNHVAATHVERFSLWAGERGLLGPKGVEVLGGVAVAIRADHGNIISADEFEEAFGADVNSAVNGAAMESFLHEIPHLRQAQEAFKLFLSKRGFIH